MALRRIKKVSFLALISSFIFAAPVEALPTLNIYSTKASVAEPSGVAEFLITRGGSEEAVVVQFEVFGTATAGIDYSIAPAGTTFTLPATTNTAIITLTLRDDIAIESEENVVVRIVPNYAYIRGGASQAGLLIRDNDPDGLPTVALKTPLLAASYFPIVFKGEGQGSIVSARIYDNGALIATPPVQRFETVTLFEKNWTFEVPGLHHVSAVVRDERGLAATSTVPVLVAEAIRFPTATGSSSDGISVTEGSVTTSFVVGDRGYGLVEFPTPELKDSNAILEFSGRGQFVHELYVYPADGFIRTNDLEAAAEFIGRMNDEPRVSETFQIDVTPWAKRYAGKSMGFRLKAIRPENSSSPLFGVAHTFTSFRLIDISRTNDVPPRARWLNPPKDLVAIGEDPLVLKFEIIDPDSRITALQLSADMALMRTTTDLHVGTNVVSITWTNPTPQTAALALLIETDTGAMAEQTFLPISVIEPRRGDPVHRWTAKAIWADAFFIVDADGRAWAWGANDWGQLGLGVEDKVVFPPALLEKPPGRKWRQFAAGQSITGALTDDGALYEMGRGKYTPVLAPFPDGVYFWRDIAAAGVVVWLLDQSGRVWIRRDFTPFWEMIESSRMRKIESHFEAVSILAERDDGVLVRLPGNETVLMPLGVTEWLDFSAARITVGVGGDRQLYAWANFSFPDWSLPVFPIYPQPTRVLTPGIGGWKRVAVNGSSTVAIDQQDRIFEWGTSGSLNPKLYEPHLIEFPNGETGWLDIGVANAFSVAISENGNAYIWGHVPMQSGEWTRIVSPQRLNIPSVWGNKLHIVSVTGDVLTFESAGAVGTSITIEGSPDLANWTIITNLANPTGKARFSYPISANGSLFIRAR
jgi:hypothetical protein